MRLADRVRELRYKKGWGPDDLAVRAKVSRTALYHLESGRTGRPQAGTLKKIARALDVAPEDLLRECENGGEGTPDGSSEPAVTLNLRARRSATVTEAYEPVVEGKGVADSFMAMTLHRLARPQDVSPEEPGCDPLSESSYASPADTRADAGDSASGIAPEVARKLIEKFTILLCSPMGKGIAQIVEESFRLLPILPAISVPNNRLYGHVSQIPEQPPEAGEPNPSSRRTRRAN